LSAYRFCRTDDIELLVDALNRCWAPHFPGEPLMTPAAFKRSIRDLQVWCSSCMVAFAGADPIGVLIGAKRPTGTLIHKIAVHPDHLRQGHGRHLLTSLSSKLAILGPPRIAAQVPVSLQPACELFRACGYVDETALTDYMFEGESRLTTEIAGTFVIPISVGDLEANGLLDEKEPKCCWERSAGTLRARADEITGLAVATDEQIEAYILYMQPGDIMALGSFVDDSGARVKLLLSRIGARRVRFPKVHPAEISSQLLENVGFEPIQRHSLYATTARPE